jgi:KTSC domain-containing protein
MERQKVNSSTIRSIGYDAREQILEIEFNNGSIQQYSRVPGEIHRRLMNSTSKASFFTDNIDENYSVKRIR